MSKALSMFDREGVYILDVAVGVGGRGLKDVYLYLISYNTVRLHCRTTVKCRCVEETSKIRRYIEHCF